MQSVRGAIGNLIAIVLGGTAAAGLLVGAALGLTGGASLVGEPTVLADAAVASFYDCPDGEPLGTVTRGDRVFITGRDASGDWAEIRSPNALNTRVWMRARQVLPDGDTGDLPVLSCKVPVEAITAAVTTIPEQTSTTTVGDSTTTTSSATSTSSTTSTTTTVAATTTTVAPPSVQNVSGNPTPIWEKYPTLPATCPGDGISTISATVTAAAGVTSVTMAWQVGNQSGSIPMVLSGGQYQGNLGPFDANDPSVVPQDGSLPIAVTVTVTDTLGRSASSQTTVTLNDCTFV